MGDLTARVRLVRTPEGQRLAIPPGFLLGGDEAILTAAAGRLIVEPARPSCPSSRVSTTSARTG